MTANIYLISGGTNYYMSLDGAKRTHYSGSGTPWTVQSTTPYDLAMNDMTGQRWIPQNSPRQEVYGGGPPFRNGQSLVYNSYGNVVETIPLQIYATSHDNAVKLLQQLRQILNTALYSVPCILAVQPDGATNTVYYEIYGADVQEDPKFMNEESQLFQSPQSKGVLRTTITIRRSPFGGATSLTTPVNGATFTNNASGNVASLGTLTGDLIYEGQPLNIKIAEQATFDGRNFYMATYDTRTKTTVTSAVTSVSTTTGDPFTTSTLNIDNVMTNDRLKLRVLARFKTLTNPDKMQVRCTVQSENGNNNLMQSGWIGPNGSWSTPFLDFGGCDVSFLRNPIATTAKVKLLFQVRSTDGTSVTATLDYNEILLYYDFGRLVATSAVGSTSFYQQLIATRAVASGPWLPIAPRGYSAIASGDRAVDAAVMRGTAPRAYASASLWIEWTNVNDNHTATATATVTAKMAPLYHSLRGNG
jgi:hypothetical protein